jgi:hypothetical protein
MSFLAVFFTVFVVLYVIAGIWGPEDRPYMTRPETGHPHAGR